MKVRILIFRIILGLSVIDYTKNSQYLLAKCEFAAIAINLNTTKQETFDSPGNFFKIQHIVSYHQSSRVLVYGTVEKDSRIYLWNLDNGDNELQSEASNMHFDQICISNYDMLLAKKSLKYLEVTTLCGDLILKKFVDYQRIFSLHLVKL